ncbi:phosphoglycolate phosphatase [Arhodomonas sp. KWT2]|uniref:phosphoglycolate phosphatase n=1 Tax=unclassified Arhodomonas TaxID=2621637 RepID=UPI0013D79DF0|nr:phosphoglycolate phosphatase [Arhodomonas sp. KWT]
MSLSRPRAVLFDLDGTLVDSAPDIATAVDRLLAELGREPVGEALVRHWVGNGARRLVARALAGRRGIDGEPAGTEAALARFLVLYRERLVERTTIYPGVIELLDALAAAGIPVAVVTNKPEGLARPLLETLGLAARFGAVVGGDTLAEKKPAPAPLAHAAGILGVALADCLMVGDSLTDVSAARNAGIPVACVPYGYREGDAIFEARPEAVVDTLADLPPLIGIAQAHETAGSTVTDKAQAHRHG